MGRGAGTKLDGKKLTQVLSCKLLVEEGLQVHELSDELKWNLRRLFSLGAEEGSQKVPPELSEENP